jgi:hypothetical protein
MGGRRTPHRRRAGREVLSLSALYLPGVTARSVRLAHTAGSQAQFERSGPWRIARPTMMRYWVRSRAR